MSAQTQFQSDLTAEQIPADALAYVGARARNRFYDFVLKRFNASGMTKAELARKIGKGPDRVNRLLGAPGNWTIETIAELLAGISGEEILPNAQDFSGRTCSNMSQEQLLGHLLGAEAKNERLSARQGAGKSYRLLYIHGSPPAKSELEITS